MIFSDRLKELRKNKDISQKQLAQSICVNIKQIQRYELGYNEPTMSVIIALAQYFNVSTDYLLGLSDDPTRR